MTTDEHGSEHEMELSSREHQISSAFVELVNQLVGDFDVIEMLTVLASRTVEMLDAQAAGILLADDHEHLRVMAASSEEIRLLEVFQVQNEQGPCLECYSTGEVVEASDLTTDERWPQFAAVSVDAGFLAVCAIPLRLGDRVLGGMGLFMDHPTQIDRDQVDLARALADVASIAIVQGEVARQSELVQGQLQRALESRVVIEQAKGMIAQRAKVDMDTAFSALRGYARSNGLQLTEVARGLTHGSLDVDGVAAEVKRIG